MQFKKEKKYCQNTKFNSLLAFLCGNYKRKQKTDLLFQVNTEISLQRTWNR